jgi:hypothetical protein
MKDGSSRASDSEPLSVGHLLTNGWPADPRVDQGTVRERQGTE